MKRTLAARWAVIGIIGVIGALSMHAAQVDGPSGHDAPLIVSGKGAHHRNWSRVTEQLLHDGRLIHRTNTAYIELANGMHYWEENQWKEAVRRSRSSMMLQLPAMGAIRPGLPPTSRRPRW